MRIHIFFGQILIVGQRAALFVATVSVGFLVVLWMVFC